MQIIRNIVGALKGQRASDAAERVLDVTLSPHMVCSAIGQALTEGKPFLASRLGWFEAYAVGYRDKFGAITPGIREKMWNTPGIFPQTDEQFASFHAEYTRCMASIDVLGLMRCPYEAEVIERYTSQAFLCQLQDLEPYYHPVPWSQYLLGLRVLVVNPFAASIERQYQSVREKLFLDPNVLPSFQLIAFKPPQTLCGNSDGYDCWNDALASTREKIANIEFDAAIIGCGAYGLPLGSFVKSLGKPCVHMGGATQALFGVAGSRWTREKTPIQCLINSHWTRPSEDERPPNWQDAEKGCYW